MWKILVSICLLLTLVGCSSLDNSSVNVPETTEPNFDIDSEYDESNDESIPDSVQSMVDSISMVLPDSVTLSYVEYGENNYNIWYDYIQYYKNIEIINSNIRIFMYKDDSDMTPQILGNAVSDVVRFDLDDSKLEPEKCLELCIENNKESFKNRNFNIDNSYKKTCYIIKEIDMTYNGILCYYYTDNMYNLYINANTGDIVSLIDNVMYL